MKAFLLPGVMCRALYTPSQSILRAPPPPPHEGSVLFPTSDWETKALKQRVLKNPSKATPPRSSEYRVPILTLSPLCLDHCFPPAVAVGEAGSGFTHRHEILQADGGSRVLVGSSCLHSWTADLIGESLPSHSSTVVREPDGQLVLAKLCAHGIVRVGNAGPSGAGKGDSRTPSDPSEWQNPYSEQHCRFWKVPHSYTRRLYS